MITALLVDDEPLARSRMRDLLRDYPDVEIVGEAENAGSALRVIDEIHPRVVFLDIQMPGIDGVALARQLDGPLIVFVTAHERYALEAFRVSAVQYLLKPVDRDELRATMTRIRQLMPSVLQRIAVKLRDESIFLPVGKIDWIESAGNYVRLHAGGHRYLLRETMTAVQRKLDPQQFLRIHRSVIVNVDRVRKLQSSSHGDFIAVLAGGTRLPLSRVYRDRVALLLGHL